MKRIANVILDRDGTVIADKHYLCDPQGVELLPGVGKALARLTSDGVRLFLATNQSGIGRGYFQKRDYLAVQERLGQILLAEFGVRFTDVAYCPHAPEACCTCRKPAPGMWQALAAANSLDPAATIMIGDKIADVGLGLTAGLAASVLVLTGKGKKHAEALGLPPVEAPLVEISPRGADQPHLVARNLEAVAAWVLEQNKKAAP